MNPLANALFKQWTSSANVSLPSILTTHSAFNYILMNQKLVESAETSNSVALTHQGGLLESLVTTTMEIASLVYGVEGICLNDFIHSLLTELLLKSSSRCWTLLGKMVMVFRFRGGAFSSPFLSRCNRPWPAGLERTKMKSLFTSYRWFLWMSVSNMWLLFRWKKFLVIESAHG